MALRLADLDEELAFDSIRAGRVRSGGLRGPRGSPPSLEPMRSPNLRVGAYGLCCAQEANPLGAQIHARGGDDTKIHDPDKSDIDKTQQKVRSRTSASLAEIFNRGWAIRAVPATPAQSDGMAAGHTNVSKKRLRSRR